MALYAKASAPGAPLESWGFNDQHLRNVVLPNTSLPEQIEGMDLSAYGVWEIPFQAPPVPDSVFQEVKHVEPVWNEDSTALVRQFSVEFKSLDKVLVVIERALAAELNKPFSINFAHIGEIGVEGSHVFAYTHNLQMGRTHAERWRGALLDALALAHMGLGGQVHPIRCEDNLNVLTTVDQAITALQPALARQSTLVLRAAALKTRARAAFVDGVLVDEQALRDLNIDAAWQ